MIDRLLTTGTKAIRLLENLKPGIEKAGEKIGKAGGKIVSEGAIGGLKTAAGTVGKALGKVAEMGENGTVKKAATNVGKFAGYAGRDFEDTIRGANRIGGILTGGYEAKNLNKALNKGLDKIPNNKAGKWVKNKIGPNGFTGHRYGALLKDYEDSIISGKRATMLGTTAIVVGGGVLASKDAVQDRLRQQQGRVVGSAGNAPVNDYAYQGASYADNAGATGDLVLSMHRQRHSGIL